MKINDLFQQELTVLNIGAPNFKTDLEHQGISVHQIQWMPPADGDLELIELMDEFSDREDIKAANQEAFSRILKGSPVLIGMKQAIDVIPGMTRNTILHSGPPIGWDRMCDPVKGAVVGALIYEGRAENEEEARQLAASGEITFSPCHEHSAVGPMAGIISPSMPVHIVENKTFGNRAYCTVNEGLGKVLRFGAFDQAVITRLKWIEKEFMPVMQKAIELHGEIDLKVITAQAVQMGDECHNRNKAATCLFFRELVLSLLKTGFPQQQIEKDIEFIR